MTDGESVVWLTEAQDTLLTSEEAAQLALRDEIREAGDSWLGDTGHEELIRLTVSLAPNSKRLVHYLTWLDREWPKRGLDPTRLRAALVEPIVEKWWVCFGTIPASKIIDGPELALNFVQVKPSGAPQNLSWREAVPVLADLRTQLMAA